jgi:hypothetical protein
VHINRSNLNLTDADLAERIASGDIPAGTTYLWLDNNQITDISPLAQLENLTGLWLYGNNVSDLSPLGNLSRLTVLSVNDNNVTDLEPLANLKRLETLSLEFNSVSDLSPVAGLTNLIELWLGNNQISDIEALAELSGLIELNLNHNNITDIAALSNIPYVASLKLNDNRISNLSPLFGHLSLEELNLRNNLICTTQISELREAIDDYGTGRHGSVVSHNAANCNGCVECEVCGATCHLLCGSACDVPPSCTGDPVTCKVPGCKECEINDDCTCKNCKDCEFLGGVFGFGRVRNEGTRPAVQDALQILRSLVGLSSVFDTGSEIRADALIAGNITRAGTAVERLQVGDALQILRFLVNLSTLDDWGAIYR